MLFACVPASAWADGNAARTVADVFRHFSVEGEVAAPVEGPPTVAGAGARCQGRKESVGDPSGGCSEAQGFGKSLEESSYGARQAQFVASVEASGGASPRCARRANGRGEEQGVGKPDEESSCAARLSQLSLSRRLSPFRADGCAAGGAPPRCGWHTGSNFEEQGYGGLAQPPGGAEGGHGCSAEEPRHLVAGCSGCPSKLVAHEAEPSCERGSPPEAAPYGGAGAAAAGAGGGGNLDVLVLQRQPNSAEDTARAGCEQVEVQPW